MRKTKLHIILASILVLLCLTLSACGTTSDKQNTNETTKQEPFIIVYKDFISHEFNNSKVVIWVDTTTQIMYMETYEGTIMLINPDGTPRLYQGEYD